MDNPHAGAWPLLVAERIEGENLPTILSYGHGDVTLGRPEEWRDGLDAWTVSCEGDRLYGRDTADNKGQHSVNIGALGAVLRTGGRLGFNCRYLIEMGEETGSPGLREFCQQNRSMLNADVLIASDGPRSSVEPPTLFLGARGAFNFHVDVALREGGQHSGNWGELLANPGIILAHAIASITSASGKILIPQLLPPGIPESVREALADIDHDDRVRDMATWCAAAALRTEWPNLVPLPALETLLALFQLGAIFASSFCDLVSDFA